MFQKRKKVCIWPFFLLLFFFVLEKWWKNITSFLFTHGKNCYCCIMHGGDQTWWFIDFSTFLALLFPRSCSAQSRITGIKIVLDCRQFWGDDISRGHTGQGLEPCYGKPLRGEKNPKKKKQQKPKKKQKTRTLKCSNLFSHLICFELFRNLKKSLSQKTNAKCRSRRDSNPGPLSLARKPKQRCFLNVVRFFNRRLLTDLADFLNQTLEDLLRLVSNFEENRTKIATLRVPQRVSAKWLLWRHRIRYF